MVTHIDWHVLVHYALVAILVALLSWVGVRFMIGYLSRNNMVDNPNERTMHTGSIPRGGGLVICLFVLMALIYFSVFSDRGTLFIGLAACLTAWMALSWSDDRVDLSPRFRFAMQIAIAALTVSLLGWVNVFWGMSFGLLGSVLSVIGILWMANLYNFMDGMDGLAASQSIVASITLGVWFHYLGDLQLAMVCTVVAAASYGFLMWNWQPANVFMGDVGSVSLGAFFATLMIVAANRHGLPIDSLLMIFSVFIADATITLANRLRKGEKVWLPHRSHFYQRAGLAGAKHAHVVIVGIVMMILSALLATFSVLNRDIIGLIIGANVVLLVLAACWVVRLEKRNRA